MSVIPSEMTAMQDAALEYARKGWPVFPCGPDKRPLTTNGFKSARTDQEQIKQWWLQWPDAMIGVATGEASGIAVLDLDRKKEVDGFAWLSAQQASGNLLPDTVEVRTPSGGLHIYFKHRKDWRNSVSKIAPGVDVRAEGGYVIVPPSGSHVGQYVWKNPPPLFDVADAPDWLASLLEAPKQALQQQRQTGGLGSIASAIGSNNRYCDGDPNPGHVERALLEHWDPDNYDDWVTAALALHSVPWGKDMWLCWAARSPKFNAAENDTKWAETQPTRNISPRSILAKVPKETLSQWAKEAITDWAGSDKPRAVAVPSVVTSDGEIFEATEDGIALAFAAQYEGHLLYDHSRGRWYEWTGDRWRIEETDLAFDYARELARQFRTQASDKALTKMRLASEVERAARSDRRLVARHTDWDADPLLLGVPGGVVDLRTGDLLKPDSRLMISRQAAVAPAATGTTAPIWAAFLNEATGGDADLIKFLQMWCGYCLTGSTVEHALCFVYGPGGNGKSVFLNTLTGILGDYATTAAMDAFTAKRYESHSTDVAALAGARLVVASETEEGKAWAEARLKQLTGGDAITARFMRQDNFTFKPQFKLTIVGNFQPTLQGADPAMQRRFNIVPFTRKPERPDKQLEEKLRAEWPVILRWMVEGCLAWQANGLFQPEAVRVATADYFADQDLFGQWLEECCDVDPDNPHNPHKCEASGTLYKSYEDFTRRLGEEPLKHKALSQRMQNRGHKPKRGPGGCRQYTGIQLKRQTVTYGD